MADLEWDMLFQLENPKMGNSPKNSGEIIENVFNNKGIPLTITFIFYGDNPNSCDI